MPDRRRKPSDILIAILGIVAGVWCVYWYLANQLSTAAVSQALAKTGATECRSPVAAGFPLRLTIGCGEVRLGGNDGHGVSVKGISATTPLYWPLGVEAAVAGPLEIADGVGTATMRWASASAAVAAGFRGIRTVAAEAKTISLAGGLDLPRLDLSGATAEAGDISLAPAPSAPGDYVLSLAIRDLRLEAKDGREIPAIALDGKASLVGLGNTLGLDPRRALRRWAAGGGKLRLDSLALTAGPVSATGKGDLAVSPAGVLSGKVVVRFINLEEMPVVLQALQPGSRTAAAIGKLLLAMTRKVQADDGTAARETTLNLGGGFVSIGIVPILALPPLPL